MPQKKEKERRMKNMQIFEMRPGSSNKCYYKETTRVSFKRSISLEPQRKNNGSGYEGPIFNRDRKFSTPAFILKSDKSNYLKNANKLKEDNFMNFTIINDERSVLLFPKPNSRNMLCHVCKERYIDYKNHIESQRHKQVIRGHPYNDYILELQAKYSHRVRKINKKIDKKIQETNNSQLDVIIVDNGDKRNEFPIESLPRKIKKVERQQYQESYLPNPPLFFHPIIPFLRHQLYQSTILCQKFLPINPQLIMNYQGFINNNLLLSYFLALEQLKISELISFYLNTNREQGINRSLQKGHELGKKKMLQE